MAISRLATQDATAFSAATSSLTATYPATPTKNNLLILAYTTSNENSVNSSPPIGWTQGTAGSSNSSPFPSIWVYFKIAGSSESTGVTVTSSGPQAIDMAIYEYTGNKSTSPLDKNVADNGTGTFNSISTGTTATTTQGSELLFAAFLVSTTYLSPSFTNSFNGRQISGTNLITADLVVSVIGAYTTTATWTGTAALSAAGMATFKSSIIASPLSILGAG